MFDCKINPDLSMVTIASCRHLFLFYPVAARQIQVSFTKKNCLKRPQYCFYTIKAFISLF